MKTAIHWFRRDLRIKDNTAFSRALRESNQVVPVFIQSDWTGNHPWTGANRQEFLCGCVISLHKNLQALGGNLFIRRGNAAVELEKLAVETRAEAIFFNRDPDPYGRATEAKIHALGKKLGIRIHDCKDVTLHERDEILTSGGHPYRVFTPYSRTWLDAPKTPPGSRPRSIRVPSGIKSLPPPKLEDWGLKPSGATLAVAGEKAARQRFSEFLATRILNYGTNRNLLDRDHTSRISQDLRFGLLSIREIYSRCLELMKEVPADPRTSIRKFISELIWREFYMQILWNWPEVLQVEFNPRFRGMKWPGNMDAFAHWKSGETGFPIVDAAMRELSQTGFMHNRARMIVSMFLTKDLHLDWRLGEQWFMQMLIDGEIASNNGGWQWSAGTGADAAPYFRIQNPWTQAKTYDPKAEYIRRWVPELRDVPAEKVMRPPTERLAKSYPLPIVDHAKARDMTLKIYDL